jgi:phospholipid/cholesterol/gamma-HCH transport system ATP-binding protein
VIRFENVVKSFGPKVVLDDVSVTIATGEVFFIVGQSGVGKSVLIKHLVGLLKPDSGGIWVDDVEVSGLDERGLAPIRKKCGMVFQHSTLFDSLDCLDNVALPLQKHRKLPLRSARAEAWRYLDLVHMREFARHFPSALGDGLKKQVAIARTLTMEPEYVLFDEPTTGLDPISARRVDHLIRELGDGTSVTCIVVSHDLTSILSIADRILMLYKGRIQLLGTRDDFLGSPDPVVQQFITGSPEGPIEV